jgi:hypothetical protein
MHRFCVLVVRSPAVQEAKHGRRMKKKKRTRKRREELRK